MNLLFCGTPDFAVPSLERIIAEKCSIDLVVTNPDEPSGRGYQVKAPPVKQAAERAGLQVFQPARLKDLATVELLSRYRPDAIVVVAYGHILPKWMLDLPRWGCINVHASLLPRYRGAAPIQWALIRGERATGVTTMRLDEALDTGDILLKREVAIQDDDTTETLRERLSQDGADLLIETLYGLERGDLPADAQDHTQATLAPILKKEDGRIDWTLSSQELRNRIRGLRPWPGAFTTFRGMNLHIWAATRPPVAEPSRHAPGTILVEAKRLLIACGQGTLLEATELQLEGRKRLPARDFLNGLKLSLGEKLG